ncbi:MAG: hypothetical protein AAGE94_05010 [Acidobacteriota bacterium]
MATGGIGRELGAGTVYRHLFTWARHGFLDHAGFQTVAMASELEPARAALESLVDGFRGDRRVRQLVALPGDRRLCVLSELRPDGDCGDGRPGNFFAESLVVDRQWMIEAGWDLAAAFDALPWWGGLRDADPAVPLRPAPTPPIAPGKLSRLRTFTDRVSTSALEMLIASVVTQRVTGEPLTLIGAADDLDRLVPLLPLLLPPALRISDKRMTFEARNAPVGPSAPRVDVAGRDTLDGTEGRWRLRLDAPEMTTELQGKAYARWLRGVIEHQDWAGLIREWDRIDPTVSLDDGFRGEGFAEDGFTGDGSTMDSATSLGRDGGLEVSAKKDRSESGSEAPLEERESFWRARDENEAEAWRLSVLVEQERVNLQAALDARVASAKTELEEAARKAGGRLGTAVRKQKKVLEEAADRHRAALEDHARQQSDKLGASTGEIERAIDRAFRKDVVKKDSPSTESRRSRSTTKKDTESTEPASRARDAGAQAASTPSIAEQLRGFLRSPVALGGLGVLIVALVAVLAWWLWPASAPPPDTTAVQAGADAKEQLIARRAAVVEALRDGGAAARVLAAGLERATLHADAAALYLDLELRSTGIEEPLAACALLQAAVVAAGQEIAIDGQCGPGSLGALAEVSQGGCCAELANTAPPEGAMGSCFLRRHIAGDGSSVGCDGTWPLVADQIWKAEEVLRIEELASTAVASLNNAPAALQALAAEPEVVRTRLTDTQLTTEQATSIALLAHRIASGVDREVEIDQLDTAALDAIERLGSADS